MSRISAYRWQLLFSFAVVGFALTAHREAWLGWRWGFLAAAGIGLCGGWTVLDDPLSTIFGEKRRPRRRWWIAAVTCLAIPAAIGYRRQLFFEALPSALSWFALPAMAIGAIEEIVWRGWLQGSLAKSLPPAGAISIAALLHAAYKTALFVFPPTGAAVRSPGSLLLIGGLTFGVGALLGCIRHREGTIAGPMGFHILFDLLVYGQMEKAPWWVM
jgi:membrane protease YdiL (CAAX protease family)